LVERKWTQRLLILPGVCEFFFRTTERKVRSMLKWLITSSDIPEKLVEALYQESLQSGVPQQMFNALRAGVSIRGVKRSVRFLAPLQEMAIPTPRRCGRTLPSVPPSLTRGTLLPLCQTPRSTCLMAPNIVPISKTLFHSTGWWQIS
jgi:hypothetical protein